MTGEVTCHGLRNYGKKGKNKHSRSILSGMYLKIHNLVKFRYFPSFLLNAQEKKKGFLFFFLKVCTNIGYESTQRK